MNLYIVRHTDAEYLGTGPGGERQITEDGRRSLMNSVSRWKKLIPKIDLIVSSPALRTQQTAAVIGGGLGYEGEVKISHNLQSGSPIENIYSFLHSNTEENIFLVMHEPEASMLVIDATGTGSIEFYFKPGSIAKVVFSGKMRPHSGKLHFFLPPDIFGH
jgi:phosphohistidine phosphatase